MPHDDIPRAGRFSEVGATGLRRAAGVLDEEFLPQLKGERAERIYREMSENDPVVGAMLYALEMLIRGVPWSAEPGGPDREDAERAEYLDSVLTDLSHSFRDVLSEWMAAPVYGYAPFEVVYKRRRGASRRPGASSRFTDGRIGVRKLAVRHPSTRERWRFDDGGGVRAFVQRPPPDYDVRVIPVEKMLLFRMRQRKGSPEGTSLLRSAYRPWYFKKRIEEIEAVGIERDLAGLPRMYVPAQWMHEDASSADQALLGTVKDIVRNVRRDEQEGVVIPSVYDAEGRKLLDFDLVSTGGRRQFDTSKIIERYDRRIAMTILADVILLGHEKVGSFALASSKTNLFAAGLGAMLDDVQEVLNRHLVPRLMRLNGWPADNPPRFRHGDIESVDLAELGEFLRNVTGAGAAIFPTEDGELERELVRRAGLPAENVGKEPTASEPGRPTERRGEREVEGEGDGDEPEVEDAA